MNPVDAENILDSLKNMNVTVIGDDIIDEYIYVNPCGRSMKDNIFSVAHTGTRHVFAGGARAIYEQVKCFTDNVKLITSYPVTKTRFVHKTLNTINKLFQVVSYDRAPECTIPSGLTDLVLIADFGHGCVPIDAISKILSSTFLALNVQTNSSNFGFNFASKYFDSCFYDKANYVCLDHNEARYAVADKNMEIENVAAKLEDNLGSTAITLGHEGMIYKGYKEKAQNIQPVDRMGAGDAVFALTSLLAYAGRSAPEIVQLGNAIGGLACGVIGNSRPITKGEIIGSFYRPA